MSHSKENTFLPTEEVTRGDLQEDSDAEQTTLSQQADADEQVENTAQDTQSQVGADDTQMPLGIRKSGRIQRLTKKGKALLDDKLKDLNVSFVKMYRRWKYHINGLKRSIKNNDADDLIDEIVNAINTIQVDMDSTYLKIRAISSPEPDIRRMNDTCQAFTRIANTNVQHFRSGDDSEIIRWPDAKSVFDSTVSSVSSAQTAKSRASSKVSRHSSILSLNAKQAAAEVVATQEVIKITNAQHQQKEEIQRLEVEDQILKAEREAKEREIEAESAKKRAQFIAESADRKLKLEEKKREVERLEELKGHVAAQARLQVYSETVDPPLSLNPLVDPFFPSYQVPVSQALPAQQARPSLVRHPHEVKATKNPLLNPSMYTSCSVPQPATFSQIPVSQVYTPTALPLMQQASTTQAPATQAFLTSHEASNDLVRTLAEAITANRVPIPEPEIFKGDPLKYNDWKLSFFTLIDRKNLLAQEKLFFLRKYVGGSAKRAIEGHFLVGTETAYRAAWDILEDRFGNPFIVAKSYRDKIHAWHKISPKDSENLREFVDFLSSVESAMPYVQGLQTLNDCVENQRIALKLPDWLSSRWNREATIYQDGHKMFPDFRYFVRFLNMEARIACNPITSFYAVKSTDQERSKPTEREQSRYQRNQNFIAKTFTTNTSEKTSITCMFCKKKGHTLHRCLKIREKTVEERVKFVQLEKLCFGCLRIGHNSRDCTSRSVCDLCGKRHPTCLHQDRGKKDQEQGVRIKQERANENKGDKNQQSETIEMKQATSNRVVQEKSSTYTSSIVPVYVSTTMEPDKEVLVYALLDSQSDTTFILKDAAVTLGAKKEPVKLKVSTITSKTKVVNSQKVQGLQVRGISSDTKIKLPTTYTRDYIPANRSHIPTSTTAKSWPHLEHLADEMSPELDCEVGLLIGYNCPQVLLPRDVISGNETQPYAQRSVLGWSIIGYSSTEVDYDPEDEIGVSHRIIIKKVQPATKPFTELKSEVHFVYRTQVKEMITPADILKVFEADFTEKFSEEALISQEDVKFLAKLKEGIKQKPNGHYEMPLPFKEERPSLPNNKVCAEHRLRCLKKRLKKDDQYQKDYVTFMEDIIARGDAEKVPESENNPADHASRGLMAKELVESNWFTGPSFLWQRDIPKEEEFKVRELNEDDPEIKRAQVHTTKANEERSLSDRLQKFSDWKRVVKAIARLKRLAKEVKGLKTRFNEVTTLEERMQAEQFIIHAVQEEAFSDEIKALKQKKDVQRNKSIKLHKLNPFMDSQDILRVGGRLTQATLHPHVKHPAILPKGHHVSRLLIRHYHEKVKHQGRGMTINELRSSGIWILGCSSEVSSLIFKCINCRKLRKCNQEQKMADLPLERMEATPPFTYSGMDCFGPFYVKDGRKEMKRYGLLFTCMCSRAIHIEVLDDLSTDAFLNALRCFIAIRGNVSQLRSDQGTNFVGARNEFQELMKGIERERVEELGCNFVMNPPSSSHMGGVWERQIRTVRSVLTSILDQSSGRLDSSSLRTFLYEVMAIVNSRPLTTEHLNDPLGPEPLTPNHILTMKSSIIAPPPGEFVREDLYLQKRWKRVQFLSNEFWTRWRKEYLLNLQQRSKWNKDRRNAKVNDIVLLQDDCIPRNQWKLAKVVEVFQGADGRVRKLKLLLSDTTLDSKGTRSHKPVYLERSIHKTVLLLEAEWVG